MLRHSSALFLCLSLVFSGCGGGGGGGGGGETDTPRIIEEHLSLTWDGSSHPCLDCHNEEALQVHGSLHYQWKGPAPDMVLGPATQGKAVGAVNSYCINILGNWTGCAKCHVGHGTEPTDVSSPTQLANIDCLVCHQQHYQRKLVDGKWVVDTDAMGISLNEAVQTVQLPTRKDCLRCHAYAGGGDAVKRGDLAAATANTADKSYDVHMSTSGANLTCRNCHTSRDHRIAGRGSDLRVTDLDEAVTCRSCHADMANGGHGSEIDRHVARVACQTCHIPTYAKNANDTVATEATEQHRDWTTTHSSSAPYHPSAVLANNQMPHYRFFDGTSSAANLGEVAVMDPDTGRYPTSRPQGSVSAPGAKLYPFKYKTANQPRLVATGEFVALDTSVYFATGSATEATRQGLINMGYTGTEPVEWVETDTYQMLNHQVSREDDALRCNACHGSTARMDLQGKLGYAPKEALSTLCAGCHGYRTASFNEIHSEHRRYDCSRCHNFSRN